MYAVSSQTGLATAFNEQHNAQDEGLVNPQSSPDRQLLLADAKEDVETEPKTDESLHVANTVDKPPSVDIEMADADLSAPSAADITLVVDEVLNSDASSNPPEFDRSDQAHIAESEERMEQHAERLSADTDIEAKSATGSAPAPVSSSSNESDDASSESDVSMQQSAADLSQSDDDAYEPTAAEISSSHDAQKDAQQTREVIGVPCPFWGFSTHQITAPR